MQPIDFLFLLFPFLAFSFLPSPSFFFPSLFFPSLPSLPFLLFSSFLFSSLLFTSFTLSFLHFSFLPFTSPHFLEKRPPYWRFHTIIKGLKYSDLCLRATTVSEEEARDALLSYVAEYCCFGKGAARDMEIEDVTASSAYHVSHSARINYLRMISLSYSEDLEKVRVLL